MKVLIAVALYGLIAVTSAAKIECPKDSSHEENIVLPNPDDCTTYFTCRSGYPILTTCPNGLHFDPKKLTCNFPEEAGCEKVSTPEKPPSPPTTPSPTPSTPSTPKPYPVECPPQTSIDDDVLLANPKDCTSFYHCSYGVPHLQYCPKGLHFNDVKKVCDWPGEAKCVIS